MRNLIAVLLLLPPLAPSDSPATLIYDGTTSTNPAKAEDISYTLWLFADRNTTRMSSSWKPVHEFALHVSDVSSPARRFVRDFSKSVAIKDSHICMECA